MVLASSIVEVSETPAFERVVTIKTDHGEAVINLERLALVVAGLVDEAEHERRMGWHVEAGFYSAAFSIIRAGVRFSYSQATK